MGVWLIFAYSQKWNKQEEATHAADSLSALRHVSADLIICDRDVTSVDVPADLLVSYHEVDLQEVGADRRNVLKQMKKMSGDLLMEYSYEVH